MCYFEDLETADDGIIISDVSLISNGGAKRLLYHRVRTIDRE